MNKLIPKIGAGIVTTAVFLFAVCLITDFGFGSYLVCMFLPIGYIMTAAGFHHESDNEHMAAANVGLIFSAVYSVLIFLVYFAQTTSVRLDDMNEQALKILDFKRGGSIFNYDMPHLEDFPRHGLLQFYIGDDDICGLDSPCKVIYIPEYKKEASVLLTENPFEDDYTGKTPFGVEGKMKFKLASRFICSNCKDLKISLRTRYTTRSMTRCISSATPTAALSGVNRCLCSRLRRIITRASTIHCCSSSTVKTSVRSCPAIRGIVTS